MLGTYNIIFSLHNASLSEFTPHKMNPLTLKVAHKPLGIWIALLVLGFFVAAPLLSLNFFLSHGYEFLQQGLWQHLLAAPGGAILVVGFLMAIKAIVGILMRRLWGLMAAEVAFGMIIALALTLAPYRGPFVFLIFIPLALTNLALLANRRWFDESLIWPGSR